MRSALFVALVALVACSSDETSDPCGSASSPCPAVDGAPAFGGVTGVAPDDTGNQLRVVWQPATDDKTAPEHIKYRIYAAMRPDRAGRGAPVLETAPGVTSAYVSVAPPGITHYVVVRAVDEDGHEDANVVEKSAMAVADKVPPTFGGVKTAAPSPNGGIELGWEAATDDHAPPETISYVVYGGTEPTKQLVETAPGVTKVTLPALGPDGAEWKFRVHARDAAGNEDANAVVVAGKLGPDATPPTFAGCGAVDAGGRELSVTWDAATDDTTAAADIAYEVRVATSQADLAGSTPAAHVTGATSARLTSLTPGTPYFVACRAIDAAGNVDKNAKVVPVTTNADGAPPTFAGATGVTVDATLRTATLTWNAGTDDTTQPPGLVYEVYERSGNGAFDFATPKATSTPGATSIVLTDLHPDAELTWVVRARDGAKNRDANSVEVTGATGVSYRLQVLPLLAQDCAVVGCHTNALPMSGLSLGWEVAYDNTVGVTAGERPPGRATPINRITPGDTSESYLYRKIMGVQGTIVGNQMPAPGTGSALSDEEKALMKRWIEQGAPRN